MTDISRMRRQETWKRRQFTLGSGAVVGEGQAVGGLRTTGTVDLIDTTTNMYPLGIAVENADTTAGDTTVVVDLLEPIVVEYYANAAAGGAIAATDMWELCYFSNYGTVSKIASAGCVAGIIVDYDATKGVGVCHRRNVHGTSGSIGG